MTKIACAVDEIRSLTSDEIRTILDSDKKGEFLLLDVRQPEEYETGHIPGSMLIPLGELEARQGELDRSKKIIAYCRSGRRSMAAAIVLCGLGFEGVQHLGGGLAIGAHRFRQILVGQTDYLQAVPLRGYAQKERG